MMMTTAAVAVAIALWILLAVVEVFVVDDDD